MPGSANGLILGIDPGLAGTGFALLSGPGTVLSSTTVITKPGPDGARLLALTRHLRELLTQSRPAEASLEELVMGRTATSASGVAQARGAIPIGGGDCGIPVFGHELAQGHVVHTCGAQATEQQTVR